MFISSRVKQSQKSITLSVSESIDRLGKGGKHIYNMTSGQLPFKPSVDFISQLSRQLNFLKSYQYGPISGFDDLRKKFIDHTEQKRAVQFSQDEVDCIISNGSKHTLYNILGALINPADEVVLFTPYWVSYPEMVKFWGGVPKIVKSNAFDAFTPHLEDLKIAMSTKTKAIILNSPNNPAGIHYSEQWMKDFAEFLKGYPDVVVISDELYGDISYFDPPPRYFYQFDPSLLSQTVIVDGISKSFACTGLRVGYCVAHPKLIEAMSKLQSQTTSGPNSLVQKALLDFDFSLLENFFDPVKAQLRECAQIIRESFRKQNLSHCWYQTTSAFYYFVDFSRMPIFEKYQNNQDGREDYSEEIVQELLELTGVALVPGAAFGHFNSARMSLTLELAPFEEAMEKFVAFCAGNLSR